MGTKMSEAELPGWVRNIASKNATTSEDVRMLRSEVFADGVVSRKEAEILFALNKACRDKSPEWGEFVVEAMSDFVVHQEVPHGYISEENANWLISAISADGVVESRCELEVLVKSLEIARSAPASLSAYALQQVANAVIEGRGPLADGRTLTPGVIGRAEVDLLRRILYAGGGDSGIGISREEADVLFDLNDKTVEADNAPEWADLFVKALANAVMCASGYTPPSREEALRREEFFAERDANVSGFLKRMVSGGLKAVIDAYQMPEGVEHAYSALNEERERAGHEAERIDKSEAQWLSERIGRDGIFHENEKALLAFIRENSPDIHPDLMPLLSKAS
jgi:hypothetical protein